MEQIIQFENIVFATPVYWYSMSSELKIFFDRLSDCISIRKDLGRSLANKNTYLIATGGSDKTLPEGFTVPFKRTADYFDMAYQGELYVQMKEPPTSKTISKARAFAKSIEDSAT